MNFSLFVPTLNEEDGMRLIMPTIPRDLFTQILVCDGGSRDATVELAREAGYEVRVQKEKGIRYAYQESFPSIRGDVVITFSPDGNCLVEDLRKLIEMMEKGYDMVIASRYLPPAKSEDDDCVTAFGNWLFTRTVNLLHGGRYTDAMTIYRAYRTQMFFELGLDRNEPYQLVERLFSTRIGIEPLLSVRAARAGCRITEIPSVEPRRVAGDRKLQVLRWGAAYFTQFFLELGWRRPARKG